MHIKVFNETDRKNKTSQSLRLPCSHRHQEYTITVESMENQIHCDTTGNVMGYKDLLKIDEQAWTKLMCNEIGRLSQEWKTHAEIVLCGDKPKDRR